MPFYRLYNEFYKLPTKTDTEKLPDDLTWGSDTQPSI